MNTTDRFNDACYAVQELCKVRESLADLDSPQTFITMLDLLEEELETWCSQLEQQMYSDDGNDWGESCLTASERNPFMH
jgi:hypothetical protein